MAPRPPELVELLSAHVVELAVTNSEDYRVVDAVFRSGFQVHAILGQRFRRISPRIMHIDLISYSSSSRMMSTTREFRRSGCSPERQPQDEHPRSLHGDALLVMRLTNWEATYAPIESFSRRPARMISG